MKRMVRVITCVGILLACNYTSVFADETITVENDASSTYVPTNIINGSFDTEPWMSYKLDGVVYNSCPHTEAIAFPEEIYFNGVDGGWNTTETKIWKSNIFEVTNGLNNHTYQHNNSISLSDKYVEMNNTNSAMLYQDLTTNGEDVILWKLDHGMTITSIAPDIYVQTMRVEIGAPNRNGADVINAHGTGDNINPEINPATKAIYRSNGVTDSDGNTSTLGYAGANMGNLYLDYNRAGDASGWHTASGIYVVPKDQTVTRFGFISEAQRPNMGNLLDNLVFSTLIGNLSAVYNDDRSATVTGYWGEIDPTKKLVVKIGTGTYELDMSSISGNFKFDISEAMIGEETYLEVYHEDYEQVKKTVRIIAGEVTQRTDGTGEDIEIISSDETIINALDSVSKNKVKHGEGVEIWIEITKQTDTIEEEKANIFREFLEGYTLGEIYDISLYRKLESDVDKVKITEANELLEFKLTLPESLINTKVLRNYKIVRSHEDILEVIDANYDKATGTLTFLSDKFSDYAILYHDEKNPNTGDNIISCMIGGGLALIGLVGAGFAIRKH